MFIIFVAYGVGMFLFSCPRDISFLRTHSCLKVIVQQLIASNSKEMIISKSDYSRNKHVNREVGCHSTAAHRLATTKRHL